MLLLTDRLTEGLRLQTILKTITSCQVVPLHQALSLPPDRSMIISDAALDNITSLELLSAAIAHHRAGTKAPLLCLTRDPSLLTLTQARALSATAILPYPAPREVLLATVGQLIAGGNDDAESETLGPTQAARIGAREAETALSTVLDAARRHAPISAAAVDHGGDVIVTAVGQASIRGWLDVVWKYDDSTYQHCLLVAGLAAAFARRLGLSLQHQRLLSQAALVHDIGKAHIPREILHKTGKLSAAEMAVMRTHAVIGYDALVRQPGFDSRLLDIVRHHHEYIDGSGYPDGLQGEKVSTFVRIVTICDIYAALIERRSYKPPSPPWQAMATLWNMGRKLDTGLLNAFADVAGTA